MMWIGVLAVAALPVVVLLAGWLWVARRAAVARGDAAVATAAAAVRLLRLSAQELRGVGVRLHGHADHLRGDSGGVLAAELGAASAQLLEVADALQDHGLQDGAQPDDRPRILREERIEMTALAEEAATASAALLAPGRRHWRMPEAGPAWLWADRRAVRHVLGRVLADAVRNTRNEDWIDIALRPVADGLALVVEDEGVGFAAPYGGGGALVTDSRGIGLRLALARSLMAAHGGRLEVEALPKVGSRVTLVFPASRLRTPESYE